MSLFLFILNPILIIEVDASHGTASIKKSIASYSFKENSVVLHRIDDKKNNLFKKVNGVALLYISGSDIASREYNIHDPDAAKKIMDNDHLLWTIHEKSDHSTIDFIRKSSLENLLNEIKIKKFYIAGITVSRRTIFDIHVALHQIYRDRLNIELIKKSKEFRDFFFNSLFDKVKLPVLLFFFLLLFINYIMFSNVQEKFKFSETTYNIQLQKSKLAREDSEKADRLVGEYNLVQSYPLALISDRIASYVPKDARLTLMFFFPESKPDRRGKYANSIQRVIIIKGKTEVAGTVLLFARYLQEDKLFSKIDIININNLKDTGSYDFELHVIL